jgi:hypothetical protein
MMFLGIGFLLMAVGVFVFPIDQLPNNGRTTGRATLGAFLLIVAGMVLGQLFVCT